MHTYGYIIIIFAKRKEKGSYEAQFILDVCLHTKHNSYFLLAYKRSTIILCATPNPTYEAQSMLCTTRNPTNGAQFILCATLHTKHNLYFVLPTYEAQFILCTTYIRSTILYFVLPYIRSTIYTLCYPTIEAQFILCATLIPTYEA